MKITKWRFEGTYGNNYDGWSKAYLLNKCSGPGRNENKNQPKQGERKRISTRLGRGSIKSNSNVEISL